MSFSLPGLAVQKDKVEQKLLNFFFFFLTNLQQKYTFNNTYPSYVECTRNFILSYSGVFLRRAGEGGRERWLQCSHAVDFMTHTCQWMVRSLDKSSPEAEWVGP